MASNAYRTVRGYYVEVARRAQQAGRLPADADPAHVGAGLMSLVLGFLLQRLPLGDVEPQAYVAAVGVLLPGAVTAAS